MITIRDCQMVIRVASMLYAVPFYRAVGYKKTTGVRTMKSFDGSGFKYQPMKTLLDRRQNENLYHCRH